MPIVDDRYTNPGWVDGSEPAIDAEEMNAISDTLENNDNVVKSLPHEYVAKNDIAGAGGTNTPIYIDENGTAHAISGPIPIIIGGTGAASADGAMSSLGGIKKSDAAGKGSSVKPIYFNSSGVAVPIDYEIRKSVPANAVFTDTKDLTQMTGVLPLSNGGSGANNGASGLKNMFSAGPTVLSAHQYGDTLPSTGVEGQMFFKKI